MAVVRQITSSMELRANEVQGIYYQLLQRNANVMELSAGFQAPQGGTAERLSASLAASQEYFQNRGGGTTSGFIDALATDSQGRILPDASRTYLIGLLNNLSLTRLQAAQALYTAADHYSFLVRGFFPMFLEWAADQTSLTTFINQLKQGTRDEDVIAQIVESQEFYNEALI